MNQINQKNLKRVRSGNSINYIQAGQVVLIGTGHDTEIETAVLKDRTNAGAITVTRQKIGKGAVDITGCSDRSQMEDAIWAIPKKAIRFV